MLTNLRESIKSSKVLKFLLLTFICAPFAFFGINSYFDGGGSSYAVKVNGTEVPIRVFEQEYNAQRNRLRQAFGGNIPQGFASEDLLRQQALETIITGEVLNNVVSEQKIVVSDQTLAKAITETEMFQNDGQFDQERYELQLRSSGFTTDSFEAQFRHDVAIQDFRDGVVSSGFILPGEVKAANQLSQQIRNVTTVLFKLQPVLDVTTIDEAEVTTYFDENSENYKHPERVKIEYIEIDSSTLKEGIEITDEEALAYYEGNSGNYRVAEERSASHILITVDDSTDESDTSEALKKIQNAKSRIDSGESFEDVAKEMSDDPGSAANGGSLGFFGKGAMVPEFEEVAYSIEQGKVSEPVLTDFGYHIIRVDEIREERGKEFDVVKNEVIDLLKQQKADEDFYDKSELLANESYENPDSLVPAAEAGSFTVKESDWIDRLSREGIAANPAVINAALTPEVLTDGNNSQILELGQNHVAVIRVKEHEEPRAKTLDEVKEEITEQLKTNSAAEKLKEIIADAENKLKGGNSAEEVAAELDGELTPASDLTRTSTEIDATLITALYAMPRPVDGKLAYRSVALPNGDTNILILNDVKEATEVQENPEAPVIDATQIGSAEYTALLRDLRDKALVEINQHVLQPDIVQ